MTWRYLQASSQPVGDTSGGLIGTRLGTKTHQCKTRGLGSAAERKENTSNGLIKDVCLKNSSNQDQNLAVNVSCVPIYSKSEGWEGGSAYGGASGGLRVEG